MDREALRATLAPHEVPAEVHLLSEIPRNAAAKVLRDDLRELLRER